MAALQAGTWQIGVGNSFARQTLESTICRIGATVAVMENLRDERLVMGKGKPPGNMPRDGYALAQVNRCSSSHVTCFSLHMRLVNETRAL